MDYTVEKLEKSRVKFTININAEEMEEAFREAFNKNRGKYRLEGFRPGKVPRKVLEAQYGKDFLLGDAVDIILPKYFGEALDREPETEPVGRPEADILEVSEGMRFAVTIAVVPAVKLGSYSGIKVKREKAEVSDKQLDEEIERGRKQHARVYELEEDRPCANGDVADIDFCGYLDGEKFEGGESKGYELELGSGTFVDGFEAGVAGMKKGEERDVEVTFPADYGADNLAGKKVVFKVKLNSIKVSELPALDDDYAKDVSEFDTFAEYREDVRAAMLKEAEKRADTDARNKLIDAIVDGSEVDVPDAMTEEETDRMIKDFEYALGYRGMKLEDYYRNTGSTEESLRAGYSKAAERTVKTRLVLEEIAKKEDIKPDDDAVNKKIEEMAGRAKKTVEEFKKTMDPQYLMYELNKSLSDALMAKLTELNPAAAGA